MIAFHGIMTYFEGYEFWVQMDAADGGYGVHKFYLDFGQWMPNF